MSKCCKNMSTGRYFIPPFWGFTDFVPTIPKLYWDVRSQEQRVKNLFELINKVICYADMLGEKVEVNGIAIEKLREDFDKFKNGEMVDYYLDTLQKWLNEHMPEIIGKAAHIVYFGLTLEGNFVAYIPQGNAWNDIQFDTGANYNLDTYGRLMLYYKTDTDSTVWQSEAPQGDTTQIIADLADLRARVHRNEVTLYTPMNENENEETIAYVGDYENLAELATSLDNLDARITANEQTLYSPMERG